MPNEFSNVLIVEGFCGFDLVRPGRADSQTRCFAVTTRCLDRRSRCRLATLRRTRLQRSMPPECLTPRASHFVSRPEAATFFDSPALREREATIPQLVNGTNNTCLAPHSTSSRPEAASAAFCERYAPAAVSPRNPTTSLDRCCALIFWRLMVW